MRKLVAFLFLFCGLIVNGQVVPQGINYQAVALDQQGQPIPGVDIVGRPIDDAEIGVRISILEASPTGNVLYQEEHEVLTDQYGMFNLTIGQGLQVSADAFNTINWQGDKFLQVELSIENDGAFTLSAVQQLMSVPYAFLADRALNVDDADADPANEIQTLSVSGDSLSLSNGNTVQLPAIDDADADPLNEIQNLSITRDSLTISAGNSVLLPTSNDFDKDSTNELQQLYLKDDSLFLTADTTGVGIPLDNKIREYSLVFDSTCRSIAPIDSIAVNTTTYPSLLIQYLPNKKLLVSSKETIIIDSLGNRIITYNLPLRSNNQNYTWHSTRFNNNVFHRDSSFFVCARFGASGADTIGTNVVNDTSYLLILSDQGQYLNHFSLDSLNIYSQVQISSIRENFVTISYGNNYPTVLKHIQINTSSNQITHLPNFEGLSPIIQGNTQNWYSTNFTDSTLVKFSSTLNVIDTIHSYYLAGILYPGSTGNVSPPTPSSTGLMEGNTLYETGLSFIDTSFNWIEIPAPLQQNGVSNPTMLMPMIISFSETTAQYRLWARSQTNQWPMKSISFLGKTASFDMHSGEQGYFDYHIQNNQISKLKISSLQKKYITIANPNYYKRNIFTQYGSFMVPTSGSVFMNTCSTQQSTWDDRYLYIFDKDWLETFLKD